MSSAICIAVGLFSAVVFTHCLSCLCPCLSVLGAFAAIWASEKNNVGTNEGFCSGTFQTFPGTMPALECGGTFNNRADPFFSGEASLLPTSVPVWNCIIFALGCMGAGASYVSIRICAYVWRETLGRSQRVQNIECMAHSLVSAWDRSPGMGHFLLVVSCRTRSRNFLVNK